MFVFNCNMQYTWTCLVVLVHRRDKLDKCYFSFLFCLVRDTPWSKWNRIVHTSSRWWFELCDWLLRLTWQERDAMLKGGVKLKEIQYKLWKMSLNSLKTTLTKWLTLFTKHNLTWIGHRTHITLKLRSLRTWHIFFSKHYTRIQNNWLQSKMSLQCV